MDKAAEFANDIANTLMLAEVSDKDPYWDYASSDVCYGLILLLLKYCKEYDVPEGAVNIANLMALRRKLYAKGTMSPNTPLWKWASQDELVAASLSGSVMAPKDTMNSILAVFDQKMRSFTIQPTLLDMLANNNIAIEKFGERKTAVFLITPDEKTAEYCEIKLTEKEASLVGDEDAVYVKIIEYNAEDFVPVLACPSQVDNIKPVKELEGTEIDQVFIGSCTNGRLEDLQRAAAILKGKKVAPFVKLIVTPASRKIYNEAVSDGTIEILSKAGAIITHPGCGLCCGRAGGILTDGERVVATNNRNFLGRMGTSKVEIFLASPATAATCAITGKITVPEM